MKLKYIFKVSKNNKAKDISQILIIIFLSIISIGLFTYCFKTTTYKCPPGPCGGIECRHQFIRVVSSLNQAVTLEKKLEGHVSYDSAKDFANVLLKRFSISDTWYIKNNSKFPYKNFSDKEIKKNNLEEYVNKPIILCTDDIAFLIAKFEPGCKKVDRAVLENSSCLIDADFNGLKYEPNTKENFNLRRPISNDRYTFIIDGNKDVVLFPEIYKSFMD